MKRFGIISIIALCLFLTGCSSEYYDTYKDLEDDKKALEEEYDELLGKYDELEEMYYAQQEYLEIERSFIGDALSEKNADDFFELIDNVGYYPSSLLGECCIDKSTWMLHLTDSECVQKATKSDLIPSINYEAYDKDDFDEIIKSNEYLKDKNIKECPICFP